MQFAYTLYYRGCFALPAFIALVTFLALIWETVRFSRLAMVCKVNLEEALKYALLLLGCLFFLSMNCGRLMHGGIYLIREREADAIEIQGEISDIRGLGRYSFPELKSDYGYGETNGVQFIIDGVPCTAIVKGTLEIGDTVQVVYLPKSGYVLSITKIENG